MNKITRQEAKAQGLNKCYGSLCPKHPELGGYRWVSGSCVECAKITLRKSRQSNPERTKAQHRKDRLKMMADPAKRAKKNERDAVYRAVHKDKFDAGVQRWRKANPEKVREYGKRARDKIGQDALRQKGLEYRLKNPEKRKQSTSNWKRNNKHLAVVYAQRRKAAKLQRTPAWLDAVDHAEIEFTYEYCNALRTCGLNYHVDHVVPLQGKTVSGLNVPWNLRVIPAKLNLQKGNALLEDVS